MGKGKIVLGILALAGLSVVAVVVTLLTVKNATVFIDNTHDEAIEVLIDGDSKATLAPGEALSIDLRAGKAYDIEVTGSSGVVDTGTFAIPSVEPFGDRYKGLYVVGDARSYAIVTAEYSEAPSLNFFGPEPEIIQPTPGTLTDLPTEVETEGIDVRFPTSVEVPLGADEAEVVHLCRWDPNLELDGCGG